MYIYIKGHILKRNLLLICHHNNNERTNIVVRKHKYKVYSDAYVCLHMSKFKRGERKFQPIKKTCRVFQFSVIKKKVSEKIRKLIV